MYQYDRYDKITLKFCNCQLTNGQKCMSYDCALYCELFFIRMRKKIVDNTAIYMTLYKTERGNVNCARHQIDNHDSFSMYQMC